MARTSSVPSPLCCFVYILDNNSGRHDDDDDEDRERRRQLWPSATLNEGVFLLFPWEAKKAGASGVTTFTLPRFSGGENDRGEKSERGKKLFWPLSSRGPFSSLPILRFSGYIARVKVRRDPRFLRFLLLFAVRFCSRLHPHHSS